MVSPKTMTPATALGVTDLASWTKFVASEDPPTETRILYHTLPNDRPDPPRPEDLTIESAEPPVLRAGADPAQVGPGGNSILPRPSRGSPHFDPVRAFMVTLALARSYSASSRASSAPKTSLCLIMPDL